LPVSPSKSEGLTKITSPSNITGPEKITSLPENEGLVISARPTKSERPTENRGVAHQFAGLVKSEGLTEYGEATAEQSPADLADLSSSRRPDFSLLNSLPEVMGYAPTFHQVTDYLLRQLPTAEQAIYIQLYRLTWGYERPTVIVGFPKLSERANVGESTARSATKGLESKGLIRRIGVVFGLGQEQGIEWEVFPPSNLVKFLRGREERKQRGSKSKSPLKSEGPVEFEPIKDNVFTKEPTQTQGSAGVGSKFSLEECRRYADHLKHTGQGIINPGGYATKIFRSAEADALIEAFLNPQSHLDLTLCTDCKGSGFIYLDAENPDRGVKPCKHLSLKSGSQ
jgi:hypothetical protein